MHMECPSWRVDNERVPSMVTVESPQIHTLPSTHHIRTVIDAFTTCNMNAYVYLKSNAAWWNFSKVSLASPPYSQCFTIHLLLHVYTLYFSSEEDCTSDAPASELFTPCGFLERPRVRKWIESVSICGIRGITGRTLCRHLLSSMINSLTYCASVVESSVKGSESTFKPFGGREITSGYWINVQLQPHVIWISSLVVIFGEAAWVAGLLFTHIPSCQHSIS